jgi:hypothetical protein
VQPLEIITKQHRMIDPDLVMGTPVCDIAGMGEIRHPLIMPGGVSPGERERDSVHGLRFSTLLAANTERHLGAPGDQQTDLARSATGGQAPSAIVLGRALRGGLAAEEVAMPGDRAPARTHMHDVAVDVDHHGNGADLPRADDDVVAGDDPCAVDGRVEERPRQAGVVHRVQVDDEVKVFHAFSLSVAMVGVGPGLVLDGVKRTEPGVEVGEGQGDVRAAKGRDDLDAGSHEVAGPVDAEDRESLEVVGGQVGDRVIVLGEVGGQAETVPVGPPPAEGPGLPSVGLLVEVVATHNDHRRSCRQWPSAETGNAGTFVGHAGTPGRRQASGAAGVALRSATAVSQDELAVLHHTCTTCEGEKGSTAVNLGDEKSAADLRVRENGQVDEAVSK